MIIISWSVFLFSTDNRIPTIRIQSDTGNNDFKATVGQTDVVELFVHDPDSQKVELKKDDNAVGELIMVSHDDDVVYYNYSMTPENADLVHMA